VPIFAALGYFVSSLLKAFFFKSDPLYDLNEDGVVNFGDLAILKKAFFKRPGPAAGKP